MGLFFNPSPLLVDFMVFGPLRWSVLHLKMFVINTLECAYIVIITCFYAYKSRLLIPFRIIFVAYCLFGVAYLDTF